jgi:hypothetical protein
MLLWLSAEQALFVTSVLANFLAVVNSGRCFAQFSAYVPNIMGLRWRVLDMVARSTTEDILLFLMQHMASQIKAF